jgi:hypothetical protein
LPTFLSTLEERRGLSRRGEDEKATSAKRIAETCLEKAPG